MSELLASAGGPATNPPLRRVRLYASGGVSYDWEDDPDQLVREARAHIAAGYTAFKMRVGTEWSRSGVDAARMIDLLRRVTEAVEGRMELMLDGNCRLNEADAHTIAGALDELGWTWFEEPMPRDPATYARLNRAVDIRSPAARCSAGRSSSIPTWRRERWRSSQPDVGVCGIGEWLRTVERAHSAASTCAPTPGTTA